MTNHEIIHDIEYYIFDAAPGYEYYFAYDEDEDYIGRLALAFRHFIPFKLHTVKYCFTKDQQEYLKLKGL